MLTDQHVQRLLDLLAHWAGVSGLLGQTLAIDGTHCDVHYRSRHYEQRCRQYASRDRQEASGRRSASTKKTPKLVFGADTASHLILAAVGHGHLRVQSQGMLWNSVALQANRCKR